MLRTRSHQRATQQFVLPTARACAQQVFLAHNDSITAPAAGLGLVRCLEPLSPSALGWGGSGLVLAWVGMLESGTLVPRCQGGQRTSRFSEARYLDLARSVLILSTFFCFSFSSSGLRGVSGSRSMYRSGMRTLSGVESCGGTWVTTSIPHPPRHPQAFSPSALPDFAHLLIDVHVVALGLQLHFAEPGNLLSRRLIGLPPGLLCPQGCLQVGDVHLVDATVPAHLGDSAIMTTQGLCPPPPVPPGSPKQARVLAVPAHHVGSGRHPTLPLGTAILLPCCLSKACPPAKAQRPNLISYVSSVLVTSHRAVPRVCRPCHIC